MTADKSDNDPSRGSIPWLAMTLAILILAYPLSMGPLWWLVKEGHISDETGNWIGTTFYAPIRLAVESSDTFRDWFLWYLSLFAPIG